MIWSIEVIPASNEPSGHACMAIWRLPQGSLTVFSVSLAYIMIAYSGTKRMNFLYFMIGYAGFEKMTHKGCCII